MNIEKSGFKYPVWFSLTILLCYWFQYITRFLFDDLLPKTNFMIVMLIWFMVFIIGVITVSTLWGIRKCHFLNKVNLHKNFDLLLGFLILIGIMIYQLYYVEKNGLLIINQDFFEKLYITQNSADFFDFQIDSNQGSAIITGFLLRILFFFFGNKSELILYLIASLEIITLFFTYLFIRKMNGKLGGILYLVAYNFLFFDLLTKSASMEQLIEWQIFILLLFPSVLILLQIENKNGFVDIVLLSFLSLLLGMGVYFGGLVSLCFPIIFLGQIFSGNRNGKKIKKTLWNLFTILLGTILGFLLIMIIDFQEQTKTILDFLTLNLTKIKESYSAYSEMRLTDLISQLSMEKLIAFFVLLILGISWSFLFLHLKKTNNIEVMLGIVLISIGVLFADDKELIWFGLLVFLCMLPSIWTNSICLYIAEQQFISLEEEKAEQNLEIVELLSEDNKNEIILMGENDISDIKENRVENRAEVNESEQNTRRFIPNPLPLPPKHVKKSLDFPYEVMEDKMKYDFEPSEDKMKFDI